MSQIDPNGLFPDVDVLCGMPELGGVAACEFQVLQNDSSNCAFILDLKEEQPPYGLPNQLYARIRKSEKNEPLLATAALQKLAYAVLPHLVPKIWGSGHSRTDDGTVIAYVLSQVYPNACTLESVWGDLDDNNRAKLIDNLFEAISKLRRVSLPKLSYEQRKIFRNTPFEIKDAENPISVGGPSYGYHSGIGSFLQDNLYPRDAESTVNTKPDGTVVVSVYAPKEESFGFPQTDLDVLTQSSIFCHNDLEPCNILDEAGFVPFAFEVGRKDSHLGLQNVTWSWYDMYRQLAAHHLLDTPGHSIWSKLIRCLMSVAACHQDSEGSTTDGQAQRLWQEKEKITFSTLTEEGWVKMGGSEVFNFKVEENEQYQG
ncbi:hypothetical protein CORC01_10545 [Colletotrichum orchidophilum]|uniref:Aminoglycoside phosphotransferase domain-containing protein n=1 Tax=Colletotrichum orchidophilum TaxID=1209926 RepID=A0A1G4AYI8_9PEZI|nr:uncharacterized protein CORC01_10545 [Colletotrichum orchidophilum]OHE94207.1 hypothetical protein CORC01_10545 [Colletotrichum orchidophilum]